MYRKSAVQCFCCLRLSLLHSLPISHEVFPHEAGTYCICTVQYVCFMDPVNLTCLSLAWHEQMSCPCVGGYHPSEQKRGTGPCTWKRDRTRIGTGNSSSTEEAYNQTAVSLRPDDNSTKTTFEKHLSHY